MAMHDRCVPVRLHATIGPGTETWAASTASSRGQAFAGTVIWRILTVVTSVLAAALITASPALADDSSFLNEVKMNGTTTEDGKSLWWGHAVCADLQSGVSVQVIYQNVAKQTRPGRTGQFIGSAVRNLCPDQMPTWQAWVNSH
jgi:hypothetical protein